MNSKRALKAAQIKPRPGIMFNSEEQNLRIRSSIVRSALSSCYICNNCMPSLVFFV